MVLEEAIFHNIFMNTKFVNTYIHTHVIVYVYIFFFGGNWFFGFRDHDRLRTKIFSKNPDIEYY